MDLGLRFVCLDQDCIIEHSYWLNKIHAVEGAKLKP
jgi:hypothetical protein